MTTDGHDDGALHEIRRGPGSQGPNYWEVHRRGEGPVLFCGDDGERRARTYAAWLDAGPDRTGYEVAAGWRDRLVTAEARVAELEAEVARLRARDIGTPEGIKFWVDRDVIGVVVRFPPRGFDFPGGTMQAIWTGEGPGGES